MSSDSAWCIFGEPGYIMLLSYDELFLETISDLRIRVNNDSPYNLVRAAGICRQLLLDKKPLVSIVNSKYKCSLRFTVVNVQNIETYNQDNYIGYWFNILPSSKSNNIELNLSKFIAYKFIKISPYYYTVKDIIRAASHCMGGIHSFKPENKKEFVLFNNQKNSRLKHNTDSYLSIYAICKVILKSMEQLELKIKDTPLPRVIASETPPNKIRE